MALTAYIPQPWRFQLFLRWEETKAVVGRFVRRKATCGECGYFFDPADKRAFLSDDPFYRDPRYRGLGSICSACEQMRRGDKFWAVTNDCNGIFEVFCGKAAADEAAPTFPDGKVIPVRVLVEPKDDWWKR